MPAQPQDRELHAAIAAERAAYLLARDLIPDLALPAAQRGPLDPRQQSALADYEHANKRLSRAKAAARARLQD